LFPVLGVAAVLCIIAFHHSEDVPGFVCLTTSNSHVDKRIKRDNVWLETCFGHCIEQLERCIDFFSFGSAFNQCVKCHLNVKLRCLLRQASS